MSGTALACWPSIEIAQPPVWSPDGRFITFVHNEFVTDLLFHYYLLDLETNKMQKLTTESTFANPVWDETGRKLLITTDQDILITDIREDETFNTVRIPFPAESDFSGGIVLSKEIYGSDFLVYEENTASTSIWKFDLESSSWAFQTKLNKDSIKKLYFFRVLVVLCEEDVIKVFDVNDWHVLKVRPTPSDSEYRCEASVILQDQDEKFWIMVGKDSKADGVGIFAYLVLGGTKDQVEIINGTLTLEETGLEILDFSILKE